MLMALNFALKTRTTSSYIAHEATGPSGYPIRRRPSISTSAETRQYHVWIGITGTPKKGSLEHVLRPARTFPGWSAEYQHDHCITGTILAALE